MKSHIKNPFTASSKNRLNLLTTPKHKTPQKHEDDAIEMDTTSFYTGLVVFIGILLFAGQVFMTKSSSPAVLDTTVEASPEELLQATRARAWWMPASLFPWMRSSSRETYTKTVSYWQVGYSSQKEMEERLTRFPGVEERVKIYMSNWYAPPCPENDAGNIPFNYEIDSAKHLTKAYIQELPSPFSPRPRLFQIYDQPAMESSTLFYLQRKALKHECNSQACQDVLYQLYPVVDRSEHPEHPVLLDLGDKPLTFASDVIAVATPESETTPLQENPQVPYFKRFRTALTKAEVDEMTVVTCVKGRRGLPESTGFPHLQPVLWKLKVLRHYGLIHNVTEFDVPYAAKKDMAVFRGRLSGIHKEELGMNEKTMHRNTNNAYRTCISIPRCRLVLKNAQTSSIDARLVGPQKGLPLTVQDTDGKSLDLFAPEKMSVEEMLQYKAIIMLEGNDVSAGLKWALFSNSVVMMDAVTATSWAMEERLVPWVHYVPLSRDGSDVKDQFQWVLQNPIAAERIAYRGSLWIKDLLFHPDAVRDEERIFDEMIRRYQAHFEHNPMLF